MLNNNNEDFSYNLTQAGATANVQTVTGGTGALSFTSAGTLTLNSGFSTGSFTATGAPINLPPAGTITTTMGLQSYTGNVALKGNAVLDASGSASGAVTITGGVTNSAGGALLLQIKTGSSGSSSVTGVIDDGSGSTSLTVSSGTLTLSAQCTYSGDTTISSGATIKIGIFNALPIGSNVNDSGTLDLNGFNEQIGITTAGTTGIITNSSATAVTLLYDTSGDQEFDGTITGGSLALRVFGGNTLTLGGANTYGGATTINNGTTLTFTASGSLASAAPFSDVNTNTSGTLDLAATTLKVGALTGSGSVQSTGGAGTLIVNSTSVFGGIISNGTGTTKLTVAVGTLTLSGSNSYTGATTISNGATLQVGNGGATGAISSATNITDNGALSFNLNSGVYTLNNFISGTGGLTQQGPGSTVNVGAALAYTGTTAVSAGTVSFSGGGALSAATSLNLTGGTFDASAISTLSLSNVTFAAGTVKKKKLLLAISRSPVTSPTTAAEAPSRRAAARFN